MVILKYWPRTITDCRATDMAPSLVWLSEYESEGHDEDLIAEIVTDVQGASLFRAVRHKERTHHAGGVVTFVAPHRSSWVPFALEQWK
jgi:hypothetical protein